MARAFTAAQWIGQMHGRGRSYAEIARATGHSADFIQKIASGSKKGISLTPVVRGLARNDARRTTGTARPLADVRGTTPRRAQRTRSPQKHTTVTGDTSFYVGGRPGQQVLQRIQAAARRGQRVQLTITWQQAQPYPPKLSLREDEAIEVWKGGGIDAMSAVEELLNAGYADRPAAALAIITTEQIQWESVKGALSWQLVVSPPAQSDWD